MTEQALDLRRAFRALGRRWKPLMALVLGGMACGALFVFIPSQGFVNRSSVLLPPSPLDATGRPVRNIGTEVLVARSGSVLGQAGKRLNPPLDALAVRRKVSVAARNADIIEVRATAGTAPAAAALAQAVANAYVDYSNGSNTGLAQASVAALQKQSTALAQQIQQLNDEIATGLAALAKMNPQSAEAVRQKSLIDSVRTAEVDAARQLALLNTRVADAELNAQLNRVGLRVLEPATASVGRSRTRSILAIGIGGLVGLLAGVIVVLTRELSDRRLHLRHEIAQVVGAPVLASLTVAPRRSAKEFRSLLERWQPDAVESLALHQTFAALSIGADRPADLVVVALAHDPAAIALAVELAAFAATIEIPTAFVVATRHPSVATLRSACQEQLSRPDLRVFHAADDNQSDLPPPSGLKISLVVRDNRAGATQAPRARRKRASHFDRRSAVMSVLAVSAGVATAEDLAVTALDCLDAGIPPRGILIANPDPYDETSGRPGMAVPGPVPDPVRPPELVGHQSAGPL